jgi:hypothetical protein
MKKNLTMLLLLAVSLFPTLSYAQAPNGINYQAVIRNSTGALSSNTAVAIRVNIRQTTTTGTIVYSERQNVITDQFGLVNFVIGSGTLLSGNFANIPWANGPFFLDLGVAFSGLPAPIIYMPYGTQQMMSVPYALYAKNAGNQLNQWRYGNTVPATALGVLGDFYLNMTNGNVYYKSNATTWILTGNITGPAGAAGATGAQGIQGVPGPQGVAGVAGPAGTNGTNGAVGATGPQGLAGIAGPVGVAGLTGAIGAAGSNGLNGQNALVKTTLETPGANCPIGGVKVESGLDANNNGILDPAEVNALLTTYVCNGLAGAQGIQGVAGPVGPAGATGPVGATGPQGLAGIAGPAGVAGLTGAIGASGSNGLNGQNALVITTLETPGANCPIGGVKVESGLDANNNGILDPAEVNAFLTTYVCNGPTGVQGIQGLPGTNGSNGAQGVQGIAGPVGLTGPTGLTGAAGAAGPQGIQGLPGTNGSNGAQGIQGVAGLLSSGTTAGNTPYWNGSQWVVNNSNIFNNGGNVGIGSSSPTSKLEVTGAATNTTSLNAGNGSTIDFGLSNLAFSAATGTAFSLSNLKDGGAYSMILTSLTNTGTATFSANGFTFKYMGTMPMTNGKTHIYSFIVGGNVVYVSMATEN